MIFALCGAMYLVFGLILIGFIVARNDEKTTLVHYIFLSILWPFCLLSLVIYNIILFLDQYGDITPMLRKIFGGVSTK